MTVQECYARIEGDYDEVMMRLRTDERVKKFLGMFLRDENYGRLCTAMEEQNYEQAFMEAHTLKGVSQNLALTALGREASNLTELLRGKTGSPEALESFARVKEKYILTKKGIEDLQAGE